MEPKIIEINETALKENFGKTVRLTFLEKEAPPLIGQLVATFKGVTEVRGKGGNYINLYSEIERIDIVEVSLLNFEEKLKTFDLSGLNQSQYFDFCENMRMIQNKKFNFHYQLNLEVSKQIDFFINDVNEYLIAGLITTGQKNRNFAYSVL